MYALFITFYILLIDPLAARATDTQNSVVLVSEYFQP